VAAASGPLAVGRVVAAMPRSDNPELSSASDEKSAAGVAAVLRVPEARVLLAITLFFMISFTWMTFLASWLVQHITGSAWLVQLVGFMQMAPMAFGPVLGRMADSGDKILMEKVAVGAVLLCSCCIAAAALLSWPCDVMTSTGSAQTGWLCAIYAHLVIVGFAMPIFQIFHLPLIKASVSREAAPAANACAVSCFGIGQIVGNQLGGVVVAHVGAAGAYAAGCGWSLVAFLLIFLIPSTTPKLAGPAATDLNLQLLAEAPAGGAANGDGPGAGGSWRELGANKEYLGVLAVTFLGNLFFWA